MRDLWASIDYVRKFVWEPLHVNFSLFPWTIPLGLGLLFYVIKVRSPRGELFAA
jgi:hypothetical protein